MEIISRRIGSLILYVELKWRAAIATYEISTSFSSDYTKYMDYYSGDLDFMNPTEGCPARVIDKQQLWF